MASDGNFRFKFGAGFRLDVQLRDGPGKEVAIEVGSLIIRSEMDAAACAAAGAFFAAAARRGGGSAAPAAPARIGRAGGSRPPKPAPPPPPPAKEAPPRRGGRGGGAAALLLAAALALAAPPPAAGGSFTFTFAGLADGQAIHNLYEGDWELAAAAPAFAVGPGNPEYAGVPGALLGGLWEVTHDGPSPLAIDSVSVAFASASPVATASVVSGEAVYHDPWIAVGPSWDWSVAAAGTYTEPLGGFYGDTLSFGPVGSSWQVTSIEIETPDASAVPEPPSGLLAAIGAVGTLAAGVRRRRRPGKVPGFPFSVFGFQSGHPHANTEHRTPKTENPGPKTRGFTLIELLVVILIIGLVSAVALPMVLSGLGARQNREAARLLAAALAGCRDRAIASGEPAGLRFPADPAFPPVRLADGSIDPSAVLCYSRWEPIAPAPPYSEGAVSVRAGAAYAPAIANPAGGSAPCPSLVLESAPLDPSTGAPLAPTSWAWNLRVGDRIQLDHAGPWYAVAGPDWTGAAGGNPERFVNWGPPGTAPPLSPAGVPVEWLILTDGRDDNANGWTDEGFDGVDNDNNGLVDEPSEWEPERWQGAASGGLAAVPYAVRRRPAAASSAGPATDLPTRVVIDATAWGSPAPPRSRLPVDRWTGAVELLVNADGTVSYSLPYAAPSSVGMGSSFLHFWLADRADVANPPAATPAGEWGLVSVGVRSGRVSWLEDPGPAAAIAQAQQGVSQ
jgi:prepilin-type N-terminal cleavage/methylation domain-containing protein